MEFISRRIQPKTEAYHQGRSVGFGAFIKKRLAMLKASPCLDHFHRINEYGQALGEMLEKRCEN